MIHEFDKKFLEQLVSKRQSTESVAVSQRNCEGFELGFHFEDIFKDIEPTILVETAGGEVYIKVDPTCIPQNGKHSDNVYLHHNHTLDLQVRVLQRIALLRQLEDNRYIIWINNGHRTVNVDIKHKVFYLANEEDKQYVQKRYNYMVVATPELIELVKHKFRDIEERRFRCSQITAWFAIAVSLLIGIASIIVSFIIAK